MKPFLLPSLGSDMDQGKLLSWLVKPGDTVRRGQVVAVVDTAKAAVDVEIWDDGCIASLLVQPGQTIPVGTPLAMIAGPGEPIEAVAVAAATAALSGKAPGVAQAAPAPAIQASVPAATAGGAPAPVRRRISPAARKHAQDLGLDIDALPGTGPDGALTLQDVERVAQQRQQAPSTVQATPAAPGEVAGLPPAQTPAPALAMRRAIAATMSRSKREIPHYYLGDSVSLLRAQQWLAETNASRALPQRMLMAVLLIKAVARAALAFPDLNGFFIDGEHRPASRVHAGVAISLRGGGLIAPALHDAAEMTLDELMAALNDLVGRARAGSLRSSEISDPTITVTNLGDRGVESVHGVIYPPQVALVGFGRIAPRVWVEEEAIRIVPAVTATLAADHRVSDGHRGALFLARIGALLQQPSQL